MSPRPTQDRRQSCGSCYYWEVHRDTLSGPSVGQCRIMPPSYSEGDCLGIEPAACFPQTYETDWCGEYKRGVAFDRDQG
jgi:hypothetical protein